MRIESDKAQFTIPQQRSGEGSMKDVTAIQRDREANVWIGHLIIDAQYNGRLDDVHDLQHMMEFVTQPPREKHS